MSPDFDDEWDDTAEWSDDEEDYDEDGDEEPVGPCPECGKPVYADTEMCPACGYWLTEADRRRLDGDSARRGWTKVIAIGLVAAFLLALLSGVF